MSLQIVQSLTARAPQCTDAVRADGPAMHPLIHANCALVDQAVALTRYFTDHRVVGYARLVGPHLRHVIEHLEALLTGARGHDVDYDSRPRDPLLQADPGLATARLQAVRRGLAALPAGQLDRGVTLRGQTGLSGESGFAVPSSLGRELAFVASHTVHHFALLKTHCVQLGWPVPDHFGQAPATVAHARRSHP